MSSFLFSRFGLIAYSNVSLSVCKKLSTCKFILLRLIISGSNVFIGRLLVADHHYLLLLL